MKKLSMYGREVYVEMDGVDPKDYPDFCDAYIAHAWWDDTGAHLSIDEMEALNEMYALDIGEMAYESLY